MGVERRSNRSRIAIVTTALFRRFPSAHLNYLSFRRNHLARRIKAVSIPPTRNDAVVIDNLLVSHGANCRREVRQTLGNLYAVVYSNTF